MMRRKLRRSLRVKIRVRISTNGAVSGNNVGVWGGIAPVRAYLERLVELVLERKINPGRVFDLELPLSEVAEAYAAMDERRAIKALLWP